MREYRKGDVVRLAATVTERTDRGVRRTYQAGHEFEVVSAVGGVAKVKDPSGCRVLLPVASIDLVRSAHSPDDDAKPEAA